AADILPSDISGSTFSGTSQPPPLPASSVFGRFNHSSMGSPPGISKSMPAFTVAAVLYVLPQSETTKPLKSHSFCSTSFSKNGFSAQYTPLSLLYADITDHTRASCTAASNAGK